MTYIVILNLCSVMKYQNHILFNFLYLPNLLYFNLILIKCDHKSFIAFYVWRGKLIKWPIKYFILYHCNLWLWLNHTYYRWYFGGVRSTISCSFIFFIFYQTSNSYKIYTYNYIPYIQSRDTFSFNLFIFKNIPINIGYT